MHTFLLRWRLQLTGIHFYFKIQKQVTSSQLKFGIRKLRILMNIDIDYCNIVSVLSLLMKHKTKKDLKNVSPSYSAGQED